MIGKRTIAIAALGLAMAAIQTGRTQAHGLPISGSWYPCCSITSDAEFRGIADPTQHPGKTIWVANVQEYQYLCYNPADNTASLQVMVRDTPVMSSEDFSDADWEKQQGRLYTSGHLDIGFLAEQTGCETQGGGHHNWIPKEDTVLVTKFKGVISAYSCDDGEACNDLTLLGEIKQDCELQGPYDAFNLPGPDVEYSCFDTELFHAKK